MAGAEDEEWNRGKGGKYGLVNGLVGLEALDVGSRAAVVELLGKRHGVHVREEGDEPRGWDLDASDAMSTQETHCTYTIQNWESQVLIPTYCVEREVPRGVEERGHLELI